MVESFFLGTSNGDYNYEAYQSCAMIAKELNKAVPRVKDCCILGLHPGAPVAQVFRLRHSVHRCCWRIGESHRN